VEGLDFFSATAIESFHSDFGDIEKRERGECAASGKGIVLDTFGKDKIHHRQCQNQHCLWDNHFHATTDWVKKNGLGKKT